MHVNLFWCIVVCF